MKSFLFWNTLLFSMWSKGKMWNIRFSAMLYYKQGKIMSKDGYRSPPISTMELFVIIVKGWRLLTIVTKSSILDVIGPVDPRKHFLIYLSFQLKNLGVTENTKYVVACELKTCKNELARKHWFKVKISVNTERKHFSDVTSNPY